ncbi:MAG: hypothetical protein HQL32_01340, partial [Planctomycetes bacterium]|nr:hypothetical protein [Planctomycetota bacterium]
SGYGLEPWTVCQDYSNIDLATAAKAMSLDCQKGVDMVCLTLSPDQSLSLKNLSDAATLFSGIDLSQKKVLLGGHNNASAALALLVASAEQQEIKAEQLNAVLSFDPVRSLLQSGSLEQSLKETYDQMQQCCSFINEKQLNIKTLGIDASIYGDSGASAVEELAYAMSNGVQTIKAMMDRGLGINDCAQHIHFTFSIGANFFMEISKFRAARTLWAKIISEFGGNEDVQKMSLLAKTTTWNKTVHDIYVNLLRTTTESFSAVVGGCDEICILPFDDVVNGKSELGRRMSRNTNVILSEECALDKVVDPAGGSWYVESLTQELMEKAWAEFQFIEMDGGIIEALKTERIQNQINAKAKQQLDTVASRKKGIIGTSMFPNLEEKILQSVENEDLGVQINAVNIAAKQSQIDEKLKSSTIEALKEALLAGASLEAVNSALKKEDSDLEVNTIKAARASQEYEQLRVSAEAHLADYGFLPRIHFITYGKLSQYKLRADFCTAFLQPGGFETLLPEPANDIQDAVQKALDSQAKIFLICAKDDFYPEIIPAIAKELKAKAPSCTLLVAGFIKDQVDAFKEAGVDDFLHIKSHHMNMLTYLQQKAGVQA